jgi:hypothetical protein
MKKHEAEKILDQIRDGTGYAYSEACTLECLNLTGDYRAHEAVRGSGVDKPVHEEGYRARLRERAIVVGKSKE